MARATWNTVALASYSRRAFMRSISSSLMFTFGIFMIIMYRSDKKQQHEWDALDEQADGRSS